MIAIVAPKRKDNKSSFSQLINYITRSDKLNNSAENISLDDVTFNSLNGINYEHNCLSIETSAIEMESVANNNVRVVDPVYHLVISWSHEDNPTKEQIFECAKESIKDLGFIDNQFVIAIHEDTDNIHCHVAVNRVCLTSYKAVDLWYDMDRLDKKMRELELKFGFKKANGIYDVINNEIVRIDKKVHKKKIDSSKFIFHSKDESLLSFIEKNIKNDLTNIMKKKDVNWLSVHKLLIEANIVLEEKGKGIIFKELSSNLAVKGSSVHRGFSLLNLEKKLGKFKKFNLDENSSDLILNDINTNSLKELRRNTLEREIRRNKRIADRNALKEEYRLYRASFVVKRLDKEYCRRLYQEISQESKLKKKYIKENIASVVDRKIMYSLLAFETLQKKAKLNIRLKAERRSLNADNKNKRLNYNEWVNKQAENGNDSAKAQLRGWKYMETRNKMKNKFRK